MICWSAQTATIIRQEIATVVGYLTLLATLLFGGMLTPNAVGVSGAMLLLLGLFLVMLWVAFTVVRHAESLAALLGEPFGTLILTLSVIGIEVALIASVILAGADESDARARYNILRCDDRIEWPSRPQPPHWWTSTSPAGL